MFSDRDGIFAERRHTGRREADLSWRGVGQRR